MHWNLANPTGRDRVYSVQRYVLIFRGVGVVVYHEKKMDNVSSGCGLVQYTFDLSQESPQFPHSMSIIMKVSLERHGVSVHSLINILFKLTIDEI